jgi:ABC-2 type transport system ATP-binding protein
VVLENGHVVVDGTAREAIRTLRADFDEQTATLREAANPSARVVSVEALDVAGHPVRRHSPGEDLVVRVTVQADEPLSDWWVGIGISLPTGQQVMSSTTKLLEIALPPLIGRRTVDFRLAGLHLGEGDYHLAGGLATWEGRVLHLMNEAASLSVEGSGRTLGPVGMRGIEANVPDAVGAQAG